MSFGTNIKMYNFHVQSFGMMQFYTFISASTAYIYICTQNPKKNQTKFYMVDPFYLYWRGAF